MQPRGAHRGGAPPRELPGSGTITLLFSGSTVIECAFVVVGKLTLWEYDAASWSIMSKTRVLLLEPSVTGYVERLCRRVVPQLVRTTDPVDQTDDQPRLRCPWD